MDSPHAVNWTELSTNEDDLLEALRHEAVYDRMLTRRFWILFKAVIILQVLLFLGSLWAVGKSESLQVVFKTVRFSGYLLFMALALLDYNRRQARKGFRLGLLKKLKDNMRAIGSLVVLASDRSSEEVEPLAVMILKQLLPNLHANDADLFTPDQQEVLVTLLGNKDKELVIAVLKALEQIGDEKAIIPVERLVAQTKYSNIQQAAQECLSYLQTRAQEKVQALTLLRPSDTNPPIETLLCPTSAANDNAQEQLLRPLE